MDLLERRRRSRTVPATVVPLAPDRPAPARAGRLRVLVVTESFLPQVNGVTNSVRRVLEHLAAEGHEAELVAPTGPATYAGFPVTLARGASLPFYADFRIGLETRRRLRATMERFRPDVVHIASPATLGYQAARAARSLGIPTVAIYQTDLVGFAERYGVPGGARAMESLTRRIHLGVDRTLAPVDREHRAARPARRRTRSPAGPAAWTRSCSHPAQPRRGPPRRARPATASSSSGTSAGWPPEKELELLAHVDRLPGVRLVLVGGGPGGGPAPGAAARTRPSSACCTATSSPGPTPRSTSSCTPGATRPTASPPRRRWPAACPWSRRGPAGRSTSSTTPSPGYLYEPGDADELVAHVERLVTHPVLRRRMALAARHSVQGRTWQAVNELLVEPLPRRQRGPPSAVAAPAERLPHDLHGLLDGCRRGGRAAPSPARAASARSSGQTGSSSVQ